MPACSHSAAARAQIKIRTFVYAIVRELDPHWQYDGVSHFAVDQVYDSLVSYAGPRVDAYEPALATAVPSRANGLLSADGRTYIFPIRTGVRFQDGSALTAEDARYSLLRDMLMDRNGGHSWVLLDAVLGLQSSRGSDGKPLADLYARAAKAVRVEDGKLKVTLHKPFAPFLSLLASYCYVVSKSWTASRAAGTGEGTWLKHNDRESAQIQGRNSAVRSGSSAGTANSWSSRATTRTGAARLAGRGPHRQQFSTRKLLLQNGDADAQAARSAFDSGCASASRGPQRLPVRPRSTSGNPMTGSGKLDRHPPDNSWTDVRLGFAKAFPYSRYIADVYRGQGRTVGPMRAACWFDERTPPPRTSPPPRRTCARHAAGLGAGLHGSLRVPAGPRHPRSGLRHPQIGPRKDESSSAWTSVRSVVDALDLQVLQAPARLRAGAWLPGPHNAVILSFIARAPTPRPRATGTPRRTASSPRLWPPRTPGHASACTASCWTWPARTSPRSSRSTRSISASPAPGSRASTTTR